MDEERDFKNAAARAESFLEAMQETKGSMISPADDPAAAIRDVITDLIHYAYRRNAGKSPDDTSYVDVTKVFEQAQQQFYAERERQPLSFDPKLQQLHKALSERQQQERDALILQQGREAKTSGNTPALLDAHKKQLDAQEKKFAQERDRYVDDYRNARELADTIDRKEKIDELTRDAAPKLTK